MMEKTVSVDLRSFRPIGPDFGVDEYINKLGFSPDALCFLNFHTMFVLEYKGVSDDFIDPISVGQNGTPCNYRWRLSDFKALVQVIKTRGIRVYIGILSNTISPVWHNTDYTWKYPELLQTKSGNRLLWGNAINPLKRFDDGSFFDDLYAEKLSMIIRDFSFDSYVAGDGMLGLRGPRETLKETDFSCDMIKQFIEYSGVSILVDSDYDARRRIITEKYYDQWVDFWSWRWGNHVRKLNKALKRYDAGVKALDSWSRSPELCRRLFGIDYRQLYAAGLETVFVRAGESSKWRKHREGLYAKEDCSFYTFLSHMAYEPRLEYAWVQPTINLPEFWNTMQDLPNVSKRELNGYSGLRFLIPGNRWVPIVKGVCLIWGNDLSSADWAWLRTEWENTDEWYSSYESPCGFVLVLPEDLAPEDDLHLRFSRIFSAGIPVSSACHISDSSGLPNLLTFSESIYKQNPNIFFYDGKFLFKDGRKLSFKEGIELMKLECGMFVEDGGRISGFISRDGDVALSLENPDSLSTEKKKFTCNEKENESYVPADGVSRIRL